MRRDRFMLILPSSNFLVRITFYCITGSCSPVSRPLVPAEAGTACAISVRKREAVLINATCPRFGWKLFGLDIGCTYNLRPFLSFFVDEFGEVLVRHRHRYPSHLD